MQGLHLRKYGAAATINFDLFEVDGVDFRVDAVHAAGDTVIMKDEGAEASTTNSFTDEGKGYSLVLTATEMQAARIVVYVVDLTATKVWLDRKIIIETYGNVSAEHEFDLDLATQPVNLTQMGGVVQSATDLKNFADAGYDPSVNKVEGVKLADVATTLTGHTVQTGDNFPRLGAPTGASVSADIAVVEGQTDDIGVEGAGLTAIPDSAGTTTLLGRIPAALFSGITSLAEWLGLIAGKQVGDATARTEIRATGAGSGTFDETTDSEEAIRDTAPLGTTMRGTDGVDTATMRGTDGVDTATMRGTDSAATETKQDIIDTNVDEIKLKTDNLPESIKKNAARADLPFLMVDDTDHVTPEVSLTVTGQRSLDGGAFSAVTGSITNIGSGIYSFDAAAADTNADMVIYRFSATGADDTFLSFKTVA